MRPSMSWECGPCPIPHTAAPAKPAPSSMMSSKCATGTIFTFGEPLISTNCARMYSTPSSLICCRTCSLSAMTPRSFSESAPKKPVKTVRGELVEP